jgi:hypothetical protein
MQPIMARPRPQVVIPRYTLASQHPNLMLRCQRAIRLLRIDMNTMRLMYVKLFVMVKTMECRKKREDVQRMIHTLTEDVFVCERDNVDISPTLTDEIQKLIHQIGAKLAVAETRMRAAASA